MYQEGRFGSFGRATGRSAHARMGRPLRRTRGGSVDQRSTCHWQGSHRRDRPFLNFNLACFLFREQESAPPYTCQREIKNCSARLAEVTAVKSIQYRAVCFHEIYTVAPVVASVVLTFTHSIGPEPFTMYL
jgi:hypothetical protein